MNEITVNFYCAAKFICAKYLSVIPRRNEYVTINGITYLVKDVMFDCDHVFFSVWLEKWSEPVRK